MVTDRKNTRSVLVGSAYYYLYEWIGGPRTVQSFCPRERVNGVQNLYFKAGNLGIFSNGEERMTRKSFNRNKSKWGIFSPQMLKPKLR